MKIGEIISLLEGRVPRRLAESWDNPGLQVGDADQACQGVLLSLDVSEPVIEEAIHLGANLILSHHPLLFTPLKSLDARSALGRMLQTCLTNGLTVYAMHTNLDKAEGGMNDYAARLLGLRDVSSPQPAWVTGEKVKLVTFVPTDSREALLQALFDAGGGEIGGYQGCSFTCPGEGTFFPGEDTAPVVGEKGVLNRVAESRIEVLFPRRALPQGIAALMATHPYEVPAFDVYPLTEVFPGEGFMRVGSLSPPLSWGAFLKRVETAFNVSDYRVVGSEIDPVTQVAVCTGSGASFIPQATDVAEVYLTGDVKYHEAQEAQNLGVTVIDVGHFAMERIFTDLVAGWLDKAAPEVHVFKSNVEKDPFTFIHGGGNH